MTTTVAELIAELQQLDPTAVVVMSKDGEGNEFSPYADVSAGVHLPDSTWSGEFTQDGETENLAGEELESEDGLLTTEQFGDDAVRCVALWPTN